MKTTWIDVRKVLLEDKSKQTQRYATGLPNAVEVGVTDNRITQWVYIPITQNRFNLLRVGYRYVRHETECISKIIKAAILKMAAPGQEATVIYEEDICLNSEAYRFYTIPTIKAGDPCKNVDNPNRTACEDVPFDPNAERKDYLPVFFSHEGFFLALQIEIVDFRDKFVIGPVGIDDHTSTLTEVNPIDFGAVGDGIADDYEPLRETIAYALANNLPINLLKRTYSFSQTLEIEGPVDVKDKGLILANGTLCFTASSGTAIHVGHSDEEKQKGQIPVVSMENISIEGASEIGLDLSRTLNSSFHKVYIHGGFGVGLRLKGSLANEFKDCIITKNVINVQISALEDITDDVEDDDNKEKTWIRSNDNNFWHCSLTESTGDASIYIGELGASLNLMASNNAFYSCNIEKCEHRAAIIDGGHGTSFINCRFEPLPELPNGTVETMIHLKTGESTRFVNCWFSIGQKDDTGLEVEANHRYVRAVNTRIGAPKGPGAANHVRIGLTW